MRLDTATTQDYPDPPVESRGWTQPLHTVRRIRTVRILLSSPEAGHSPYTQSGGSGLSGSSCRVPRLDTAPTHSLEDPDCPDPPVESRGWTQPLHTVRRIRTVRILLSSPEAGHSPYTQSGGSGLSGSSCRVPRLDTAPTHCPEDPDCPDPPVESRGWTQPLHTVRRIRTVRILLSSPEAGHSPYTQSGGSGLSGSSCRVPMLDTAPTHCPEDPDCPDPPVESRVGLDKLC